MLTTWALSLTLRAGLSTSLVVTDSLDESCSNSVGLCDNGFGFVEVDGALLAFFSSPFVPSEVFLNQIKKLKKIR